MGTQTTNGSRFRFGVFELDLRTGELRKNGTVASLPHQPCKILALLVSQPGELITREEIKEQIWGNDTFVDFENGLNSAIKRIRTVLDDDADSPRYIETLPRRGYRFIAPLEKVNGTPPVRSANDGSSSVLEPSVTAGNGDSLPIATPAPSLVMPGVDAAVAPRPVTEIEIAAPVQTKSRALWRWAVVAAIFVIVVGAVVVVFLHRSPPAPTVTHITQLTHDRLQKGGIAGTDGTRIYFTEESTPGTWTPAMVSVKGGETTTIHTPFEQAYVLDLSADGSELLVQEIHGEEGEGKLWALSSVGGTPRQLGNLVASEATWSPDGGKILYIHDNDLYIAQADGTESHKLVTAPGKSFDVSWSPDGKRISLSVDQGNAKSDTLWEINADGTNLHSLLPDWNFSGSACCGRWTPDGKYLLFIAHDEGPVEIWAIRERSGFFREGRKDPVRLTQGPFNFAQPLPSKDLKRIFASGWSTSEGELVRYDPTLRQFLPYLSGISAEGVDFTRDDKWVTYVAVRNALDSERTLWRSRVDGSERLQLTFSSMQVSLPRWSPDGSRIAFTGREPGKQTRIYLIPKDGGQPERLKLGHQPVGDPNWSPDGHSLVFGAASLAWGQQNTAVKIRIINLDTHQISVVPESDGLHSPRWSPDGRFLAALTATVEDRDEKLKLFNMKSQKWTELGGQEAEYPTWSPDAKYVYYAETQGEPAFMRVRISDRKVERVASLKGVPWVVGITGWWFGFDPDDRPLLLRVLGSPEIYALDWEAP